MLLTYFSECSYTNPTILAFHKSPRNIIYCNVNAKFKAIFGTLINISTSDPIHSLIHNILCNAWPCILNTFISNSILMNIEQVIDVSFIIQCPFLKNGTILGVPKICNYWQLCFSSNFFRFLTVLKWTN